MESIKHTYRVERRDINYIRTTLESYDGMAVVRTLDPREALIEISLSPGCEQQALELLESLRREEKLGIGDAEQNPHLLKGDDETGPTCCIITMGCQMNEYDSEYAAQCLLSCGYARTKDPAKADVIIINTCSVREKAEHKAVSTLGRMAEIKRRNPDCTLVFAGCVAQQEGRDILERFPELDIVLGTRQMARIRETVESYRKDRIRVSLTDLSDLECLPAMPDSGFFTGRVKGFITVMQGCNNFCSYCIVPYVRGREVSRAPEEVVSEAEKLVNRGVREITLLGQNVNSYQWSSGSKRLDFPGLLREIHALEGVERLRFTTSHPKDLSPELIQCFGDLERLCPHLHLPFQAGSNTVLKRMNRKYTREHYLDLVRKLRKTRPDIALSADVMVGFPGESFEDFEYTLDLIQSVGFHNLYSFKYSDRKGTAAAGMDKKINEKEKGKRLKILQDIQSRVTLEKHREMEGREVEVLVDGLSKKGGQMTGRTGTNIVVNFNCNNNLLGKIVKVKVQKGFAHSLHGELSL